MRSGLLPRFLRRPIALHGHETALGLEEGSPPSECVFGVGKCPDHMPREHDVERARSEGWIGGIADDEPNGSTRGVRLDLSLLQHCGGQVDADYFVTGLGHKNGE